MKKISMLFPVFLVIFLLPIFVACDDDLDGYPRDQSYVKMATINSPDTKDPFYLGNEPFFLTLDNSSTLWPAMINPYLYWVKGHDQQRIIADFTLLSGKHDGYDHFVRLNNLQQVLTKQIDTLKVSTPENSPLRGTSPIDMVDVWIGDGYVNIVFDYLSSPHFVHYVSLVYNEALPLVDVSSNALILDFVHDNKGDLGRHTLRGIVAYKIPEDLSESITQLHVRAKNYKGNIEIVQCDYRRKAPEVVPESIQSVSEDFNIE